VAKSPEEERSKVAKKEKMIQSPSLDGDCWKGSGPMGVEVGNSRLAVKPVGVSRIVLIQEAKEALHGVRGGGGIA
jgi:hypothetical protein